MKKLLLAALSAFVLLTACNQKWYDARNIKRQHLYNYMYPPELAKDCAQTFPAKDSIGTVKPAFNKDYTKMIDSLQGILNGLSPSTQPIINVITGQITPADTSKFVKVIGLLRDKINALREAYKPCKPDTIPVIRVDMAKINVMTGKYNASHDSLTTVKTQLAQTLKAKNMWMWIAIGSILLILIYIVAKVIIFFYGGGWTNTIKKII